MESMKPLSTEAPNMQHDNMNPPTSMEYRFFCRKLDNDDVERRAMRIRSLAVTGGSWESETQYERDFWKWIARAVMFDELEARPIFGSVTCPRCGNYYAGHATGAGDICTCHQEEPNAKKTV